MRPSSAAKKPRKVLSLLRVSSTGQADPEKDGLPRQERQIAEHCKKFNLVVGRGDEYRLEGISGAKVQYNPQFLAMLERMADPSIAGIVIARMDRFFRPEHLDAYEIFKTFRKNKKLLFCDIAGDDGLDVSNAQDQMKIQLWGMIAAQERRNIAERNIEGKNQSRLLPDRKSDTLPTGVSYNPKTRTFFYNDEAKRVKGAFKAVLAGETLHATYQRFGFCSQTGLRKVLRNQWYIGNKTHLERREYKDGDDKHGHRVPLEKPVIVPTNLAGKNALVTVEEFQRVQAVLDVKKSTWTQRKAHGDEYLGPGLLHCVCGQKMYLKRGALYSWSTTKRKPDQYICASRVKGKSRTCDILHPEDVDPGICWTAVRCFIDETFIKTALESNAAGARRTTLEDDAEHLQKTIKSLEAKKQRAVDLSLEDDAYVVKVRQLTDEIRRTQAALATINNSLATLMTSAAAEGRAHELKQQFWGLCDAMIQSRLLSGKPIKELTTAERKALLNGTLDRINLCPDGSLELVLKGGTVIQPMTQRAAYIAFLDNMAGLTPAQRKKNLAYLMTLNEDMTDPKEMVA